MKVVILAGGFGTRISEESHLRPKPMTEIGQRPILWHIMKAYSHFGFNDFVICLGYKGYYIKEYFAHYFLHESDVTFDFRDGNKQVIHNHTAEPWKVTLVNTGVHTMTGGRVLRARPYLGEETFMLTYGDGLSDVDPRNVLDFHRSHGRAATLTTCRPGARFGGLDLSNDGEVLSFREKSKSDSTWINSGFMVFEPDIFDSVKDDATVLERAPFESLSASSELMAYRHDGFFHPMDTLRDREHLEELWASNEAPWKVWSDAAAGSTTAILPVHFPDSQ